MVYMSSGRGALWLILKSLSALFPERHNVVIPAYTCPAVAAAVLKAGLRPVLCDVNLSDFGYDIQDLKCAIDESVLAVIAVHLFGFPSNLDDVIRYCKPLNITVVEDAAQAFGNQQLDSEDKLGVVGDVGFFSFGRGKPVSVLHGGLMVTRSEAIYERASDIYQNLPDPSNNTKLTYLGRLSCYGAFLNPFLYWLPQSLPFLRLGETIYEPDFPLLKGYPVAAGIVEALLKNLERDKDLRRKSTILYNTNLPKVPMAGNSSLPSYPFLRYPFLVRNKSLRDQLIKRLTSAGISGLMFYPCPLNELPGLKEVLGNERTYEKAKMLSEALITLPVHEGVSENMIEKIGLIAHEVLSAA